MSMLFDDDLLKITEVKVPSFEKWIKEGFIQADYRIAIATYKRHECLKNKTLKILSEKGIDPNLIDIFVADEEEKKLYEKTLVKGTYSKIIVGILGVCNIRNFIQNYYPEGQKVVSFDDDVYKIEKYVDEKTLVPLENLNEFISYAFFITEKMNCHFWGVYGVSNPYFMDNSIAMGLRYLEGSWFGTINTHAKEMNLTNNYKEDFERSIRAYLFDGDVVRFDFVTFDSKFWTEPGGLQYDGNRTTENEAKDAKYLLNLFPQVCKQNTAKKDRFEVKLVEQRAEFKEHSKRRVYFEEG